jgi:3-hydroxybutyryl-CoA dehydrogenase
MGIARVGIVGAGTMGSGIAVNLATHGKDVRLVDSSAAQLDKARDMARQHFARAVEKGRMDGYVADAALARITVEGGLGELRYCQLVIEAVFEDLDLKAEVLGALTASLEPDTLLATNTSCLRVSDLARHVGRPERFLGLHYFSPAQVSPIVEVVQGASTAPATIEAALAFCRDTGKQPIRCRDSYGFAINRFFCPYTNEAVRALDDGLGTPAGIDAVAKETLGAAAGPFQVMNLIKPRINLHAIRNLAPLGPFYAPARSMVEIGEADRPWDMGAPDALEGERRQQVADRLMLGCFLPVLQELDEGVASPADIDQGARLALRLGNPPCSLMDSLGPAEVERIVAPALERHGLGRPRALGRVGRLVA